MTILPAVVLAASMALSTPTSPATVAGTASWYDFYPRQAAAGPRLRAMLGSGWRGSTVKVCVLSKCLAVRLTDWCQCYRGTARERLIDLDDRTFAALMPLSRGIVRVKVVIP
jgi:hypothetical protein